jgi:glutathionyl-hydroquinone reductase
MTNTPAFLGALYEARSDDIVSNELAECLIWALSVHANVAHANVAHANVAHVPTLLRCEIERWNGISRRQ